MAICVWTIKPCSRNLWPVVFDSWVRVIVWKYAEYLSDGDADFGSVEVSVFGGYEDERGDAAKNSMSLLRALYDDPRLAI